MGIALGDGKVLEHQSYFEYFAVNNGLCIEHVELLVVHLIE